MSEVGTGALWLRYVCLKRLLIVMLWLRGNNVLTSLKAYVPRSRMKCPYICKDKNLNTDVKTCHSQERKNDS